MEQRIRSVISEGRIEEEALVEGIRLEKTVSPASTKQAMIARVSESVRFPCCFPITLASASPCSSSTSKSISALRSIRCKEYHQGVFPGST